MKKLLVVLLTVAFVLSLTVMASAATTSMYVGGEAQVSVYLDTATQASTVTPNSGSKAMVVVNWTAKVEDDNTWAQIRMATSCWGATPAPHYAVGFKGLFDAIDFWYNTGDDQTAKLGQIPLGDTNKWGGDPIFTNNRANAFYVTYKGDALKVALEYEPTTTQNKFAATDPNYGWFNGTTLAVTYNLEAGDIHFGYSNAKLVWDGYGIQSAMVVGGKYKFDGLGTFALDYHTSKTGNAKPDGAAVNVALVSMNWDALKLETIVQDTLSTTNDIILGLRYNGIEKTQLGLQYFTSNSKIEAYYQRNVGVLDLRAGLIQDGGSTIYLSAHAGMW